MPVAGGGSEVDLSRQEQRKASALSPVPVCPAIIGFQDEKDREKKQYFF
ncbi:hypothetical protein SLEP1_g1014 [Rubroshorea leprosula]|uniref:Uncharacterized protein n=1 Tax=Rubroshorea leprosula TaxID=152421 RepID=A0AAV5HCF9_9ROSI|nr:hypothetical protein SLEP1_g1014 [Rubroshorea leprosula]